MWLLGLVFLRAAAFSLRRELGVEAIREVPSASSGSNSAAAPAAMVTQSPSGPEYPPPGNLWTPAKGATPEEDNFIYLQSDQGDGVGGGLNYTYTPANTSISVQLNGNHLSVSVDGNDNWSGDFVGMDSISSLETGYYGGLMRYPFNNPAIGGLSWDGNGVGCNTLTGWFVVDNITFSNDTLATISLRFEQHCDGATPALHGEIKWNTSDPVTPPGPVYPPPRDLWTPVRGTTPKKGNFIYLQSDPGDWVGGGLNYTYTPANTSISVQLNGNHLSVSVDGNDNWNGDFVGMDSISNLEAGYYGGLMRYPFNNPAIGGLSWYGDGAGCNTLTGWFVVDNITFSNNTLATISLRFEQHCEGATPALHGEIKWNTSEPVTPPGPVYPPPRGLWTPARGTTPKKGNFIYLQSDPGDYIGGGLNYTYTPANTSISVQLNGNHLSVSVDGNDNWDGDFVGMNSISNLKAGYYGGLMRYPFSNPVKGGLSWDGDGRGCNTLSGWFVVDNITYTNGTLETISLRFQQNCEGGPCALHGMIKWNTSDIVTPPGPVYPPPRDLWTPARGTTPKKGNFIYLQSDPGEWVGQGLNYTYTPANASISIELNENHLSVSVDGNDNWSGNFVGMDSISNLEIGYYGGLMDYPFNNPAKGGLSWEGDSRGSCGGGWFVVDNITFSNNTLATISLRFQQNCEGALHGLIKWNTSEPVTPPGPVYPPPRDLWTPARGTTPKKGNFIYLQSDPGDFIGQGLNYTYTPANTSISVQLNGNHLSVSVDGNDNWNGDFVGMDSISNLEAGYYGGLMRYPFNNPAKGGLSWDGNGCGCNTLTGWFVVDNITFSNDTLATISLRFEQHCEGATPALHGEIKWNTSEPVTPPGPVYPPPRGLWTPARGTIPKKGNFIYLQSDPGDYIGQGLNYTYTPANASISVQLNGNHLSVSVGGNDNWSGDFVGMNSISCLEAGYYGGLMDYPFNNPAKGGLSWDGNGRGCNTLSGWFVVDNITYTNGTLETISLRFQQNCEEEPCALLGMIKWNTSDIVTPSGPVYPPPRDLWTPARGTTPKKGNFIYLQSDPGEWVGQGLNYTYTPANASISVRLNGNHLSVSVDGNDNWNGDFVGMNSISNLEIGYYGGLMNYPFDNPAIGGLSWYGDGRGSCGGGWFVVDNITFSNNTLATISLRFQQNCEGALHGVIKWNSSDIVTPPGPVYPPPRDLWTPARGTTPKKGNFIYLQSDPGEWVGQGLNYTYTPANASISVQLDGNHLSVNVDGNDNWNGDFVGMDSISNLEIGYYGGLMDYPSDNPAKGGLSWEGDSRGSCGGGWFVVDNITFSNNTLATISLRFQQNCEGALHGVIKWNTSDIVTPPGPVYPPPRDLWTPARGTTPKKGNFIYLQSDPGDFIGGGLNYTFTPANTSISVQLNENHLSVNVNGNDNWDGDFVGMDSISNLEAGYYGGLMRYPFNNPTKGGLSWDGNGCGCNTLTGWFVVDDITFSNDTLATISLRFEQHCEGATPALHGEIKWNTSEPVTPPGPVYPPPRGLWTPARGTTPKKGNFIYLQSDPGDYIGEGLNYTYTPANTSISVQLNGNHLSVSVDGNDNWSGDFVGMDSISSLEAGYYGGLMRYPFNNPVKGGLSWDGNGAGCNTLTGWFVVDNITFSNDTLATISLRFEQHCEGATPALHGEIKWNTSDPVTPPGPVYPPPHDLWKPAEGATPKGDSFIYLQSDPGDFVGGGLNYTYTPANTSISIQLTGNYLSVAVNELDFWYGDFKGMDSISDLEAGYYGGLIRFPFNNPAKGGLSWYGGAGCNTLTGWFTVDSISYSSDTLATISLRFEQHCEGAVPALHGVVQWNTSANYS